MSNSPLNHKRGRGITGAAAGLFGGRKRKRNSNLNDPNTLNKLQTISQRGGMSGGIASKLLKQQQGAESAVNQEALGSVENTGVVNPIDIQKEQMVEASGLSALTQGPTNTPGSITAPPVESGTLADRDYNTLMGGLNQGSAFAMKSPLKQGSYEDPEQAVDVDTSVADAITSVGSATANAVSKIENNNNNEDKNNKDEE